ncbi:MAG: hypothetical protein L3K23_06500 [Thermoplasmata archaeon]|nr:hypothetical protein [Thermoplasmata archaeon]
MVLPTKRGITRFTVMAMLQAARAKALGLERDSAYSWGLNRAIFYAAAKRGFRGGSGSQGTSGESSAPATAGRSIYRLGEDEAYRDPSSKKLYFTIGDQTQTEEEFQRQVADRFGSEKNFREAWEEALQIVKEHDAATLGSRSQFYEAVYKPRRDPLAIKWADQFGVPLGPTVRRPRPS